MLDDERSEAETIVTPIMMESKSNRLLGLVCVILSALGFSVTSVLAKVGMGYGFQAMHMVFLRGIMQTLSNMIAFPFNEGLSPYDIRGMDFDTKCFLLTRGIVGVLSLFTFYAAIEHIAFADATICLFTAPGWAIVLGRLFLGEPILRTHVFAFVLILAGVVFIVRPSSLFGPSNESAEGGQHSLGKLKTNWTWSAGIAVALLSAIFNAFAMIATRKLKHVSLLHIVLVYSLISTIVSGISVLSLEWPPDVPWGIWLLCGTLGPLGFISQVLLNKSLQLENASTVTIVRSIDVVFAFIWQLLLFGRPVSVLSLIGGTLVVMASLLITISKFNNKTKENETVNNDKRTYEPVENNDP